MFIEQWRGKFAVIIDGKEEDLSVQEAEDVIERLKRAIENLKEEDQ